MSEITVRDLTGFASTLARFLRALYHLEPSSGPAPGQHNWFRGAPPAVYADETIAAIDALGDEIPREMVERIWEDAVTARPAAEPVWFHGDVAVGNLLTRQGKLAAVIDFGSSGVGDPACDIVIAWTFLDGSSRDMFRRTLNVDQATWSRGRGWALWKALITLQGALENGSSDPVGPRRDILRLIADYTAGQP